MNGSQGENGPLLGIAERVADESKVDWDAEITGELGHDQRLRRLREIARIADAYRDSAEDFEHFDAAANLAPRANPTATSELAIGRWGPLELLEEIGGGSFGRVYRARDPRLEREVALKLVEVGEDRRATERAMAEGRRLARVRHPHILGVHGADHHEGKVGIWAELVRGEDLEARLEREGRLGAGELRALGYALCQALSALHAEGLVHADLKAANVMRDAQGHILLVDLGSSFDASAAVAEQTRITATPLASAPEVLAGEEPTPRSDLWSLGALLYRMATGEYPINADSFAHLRAAHEESAIRPLRDLRPDLPTDLVNAIEVALAASPNDRPASAGAFERLLASDTLGMRGRDRSARPRLAFWAAWTAAAAIVLLGAWSLWVRELAPTGIASLAIDSTLYLSRESGIQSIRTGATIEPGDQLYLEVEVDRPTWVYVLNEDAAGAMTVLFPLVGLDALNPLAHGRHRLPGATSEGARDWQVTTSAGTEIIAIFASDRPLPPLEDELAALPRAGAETGPLYAQLGPETMQNLRGVAGLAPSRTPVDPAAGSALEHLAAQWGEQARGDSGLEIEIYRLSGR